MHHNQRFDSAAVYVNNCLMVLVPDAIVWMDGQTTIAKYGDNLPHTVINPTLGARYEMVEGENKVRIFIDPPNYRRNLPLLPCT